MLLTFIFLWFFTINLTNSKSTENNNILDIINFQSIEVKNLSRSFEHCLLEFKFILFCLFDEYNNNVESEQLIEFEFFVNQSLNVCSKTFSNISELTDNNKYPTECLLFIQKNNGGYDNCFSLLNKLVNKLDNSKAFRLYERDSKTKRKLLSKKENKKKGDENKNLRKEIEQKAREKKKKEQKVKNIIKQAEKTDKKKQKKLQNFDKPKARNGKTNKTNVVSPFISKSKSIYVSNTTTVLTSTIRLLKSEDIGINSGRKIYKSECEQGEEIQFNDTHEDEYGDCDEDDDNKKLPLENKVTTIIGGPTTKYEVPTKIEWMPYITASIKYVTDTKYYTITNSFSDFETVTFYELKISDTVGKKTIIVKIKETITRSKKIPTSLYDTITLTTISTLRIPTTIGKTKTDTSVITKTTTELTTIVNTRAAEFTTYLDTKTTTATILLTVSSKICNLLDIVSLCSPSNAETAAAAAKAKRDYDKKTIATYSLPLNTGISPLSQMTQSRINIPSLGNEPTGDSRNFDFHQYNFSSSENQTNVGNSKYNVFTWFSTWLYLTFILMAIIMIM